MPNKLLRLPPNEIGQDYVVGDIHGYFSLLDILLQHAAFDPRIDRLICVGDLIDRGPESERALEYLAHPWFYATLGNHEELLMQSGGPSRAVDGSYDLWMRVGGDWSIDADLELLEQMNEQFAHLPLVIEVPTSRGKVGIVHADVPHGWSWDELTTALEQDKLKPANERELTWSRERYKRMKENPERATDPAELVAGVYRVFVGHCIVSQIGQMGNVCFIDTGVSWEGSLSLINLHTEQVYSIPVNP